MKNLFLSFLAMFFCIFTSAQTKGFAVNLDTQQKIDVNNYLKGITFPKDIEINSSEGKLYSTKNGLADVVEVSVTSNKANLLFIVVSKKTSEKFYFFKGNVGKTVNFYDEDLNPTYSYDIIGNQIDNFNNYSSTYGKPTCYQKCRAAAYAEIESDWLSDLACSINPCGAMIAIHCGGCCKGFWDC